MWASVGSGAVAAVRSCDAGMEYLGLAPNHRRWVESGAARLIEESGIDHRGRASKPPLQRASSVLVREGLETDTVKVRIVLRISTCPLTSQRVVALPAIKPNVAVIHVTEVDPFGNACFEGISLR